VSAPAWSALDWARVDEMIARGESQSAIARAFGTTRTAVFNRLRRRRAAALTGPSGDPATTAPANVHAGLQLKGQSALVNADGELAQRWDKSGAARAEPTPVPPHFALRKVSQFTDATGMIAEWRQYSPEVAARFEAAQREIKAFVAEYVTRSAESTNAPERTSDDLKTYYPIGDAHIGMLAWGEEVGESFDLKIAEAELIECHKQLVDRSPPSRTAEICDLGDWWHAQNTGATTPASGHKLDVDGRYGKVMRVGIRCGVALVESALQKHERVRFTTVRGNHDPEQSLWLAETMRAYFRNEPRVEIAEAHKFYQFSLFGRNLVLWAHGDGAKPERLPQLLLARGAEWITQTKYRYAWTGHVHSKNAIEFGGLIWESFNTLAGKDAWHSWKGYDSMQRLQSITLHREWGEDSRVTVGVERVRAAIARAA
jgi:transposase-like protein